MTPFIDILLAVYNNEEYIIAQLESLMEQTYLHSRIIIRDDCSSDHSIKLIEAFRQQYPEKIFLIRGKKNLGACGNFAFLMSKARADYLMFCDADDIWLPTKIEESLALMQKNEKMYGKNFPLLVHGDLTVVNKHLHSMSSSFWKYSKINPHCANFLNRLLAHNIITGCTMLINQPLLQLAMPIPQEAIMHDWWIGIVASAFGRIDFLSKPMILYRQHDKNKIGAKNWRNLTTYLTFMKQAIQKKGRQEIHQHLLKTIHQASQFLNRYGDSLESSKKKIVQNYVALGCANPLKKRYLFFRHRYFKNTLAKNVGMFFLL